MRLNCRLRSLAGCALIAATTAGPAVAGEVDGLGGVLKPSDSDATTYSWAVEYRQNVTGPIAASFEWLNEGHLQDHHRDGQAIQLWWSSQAQPRGLVFDLGIGPYWYYDTTRVDPTGRYENAHGAAAIASADVSWYFDNGWFMTARLNRVQARDDRDTTALVLGGGYHFDSGASPAATGAGGGASDGGPWEADAYGGQTVANTFRSQRSAVGGLGLRYRVYDWMSVSVSYLNEAHSPLGWRDALLSQLWLQRAVTSDLSVEAGVGLFSRLDDTTPPDRTPPEGNSAVIGIGARYAVSSHWLVQLVWDRIGTGDNHDADVVLLGAGYRF